MIRTLAARNLRQHARLLAAISFALAVFEGLIVWAAAKIEQGTGLRVLLEQFLPESVRTAMAPQLSMFAFPGAVAFGFAHPVALVAVSAFVITAATIPAGERESGFLEIVLARPVDRSTYLGAALAVTIVGAIVLPGALLTGAALGLSRVDVPGEISWVRYVPAAAGLAALELVIGGIAFFFGATARRRGVAVGRAVATILALYFLELLAGVWDLPQRVRWISPFHYFDPVRSSVISRTPPEDPAILIASSVVLALLAAIRFRREDL